MPKPPRRSTFLLVLSWCATCAGAAAQTPPSTPPLLTLPAFVGYAHPNPDAMARGDDGTVARCEGRLVFYVLARHTGELHLRLQRTAKAPAATIVTTLGDNPGDDFATTTTAAPASATAASIALGDFELQRAGYVRISLATGDGTALTHLHSLTLDGPAAAEAHANVVERRNAASVHLGYEAPKEQREAIEWFYVELTPREEPLWTYYMATGWHRGYFGMQVNSPTERRLIFSVWDAGNEGIDRKQVAAPDRVQLVAKGDGVDAGEFGHEGTGGHSHVRYAWQLGTTYRFLLHAEPDGDHTTYTGWFWFDEKQQWGLIASFRAPRDGKFLHGLYSFSENFGGANGDAARECEFGNAWVRTHGGEWLPITTAHFTHDGTGSQARLDRWASVRGGHFVLHHGGFTTPPDGAATHHGDPLALPPRTTPAPLRDAQLPTRR